MNKNYEESLESIETWMPSADYVFSQDEKRMLRPVAETFAMMDGNAFFDFSKDMPDHYEQYLPEAYALVAMNGGIDGVVGGASFIRNVKAEQNIGWLTKEIWNSFVYTTGYISMTLLIIFFGAKSLGVY